MMPAAERPPRVSVAIAAYNQERLIGETVESALAQDFTDFEIVVADDGSTDRTAAIVEGYAQRHPGVVRLIRRPANGGITANSNTALEACRGELIAWLGGDDLFKPTKLGKQVEVFDRHSNVVVCHHPVEWFDSASGETISIANEGYRTWRNVDDLVRRGSFGSQVAVMHRRDATPTRGFSEELKSGSDWLFFIELALAGDIHLLKEPLARYRQHSLQASQGADSAPVYQDGLRTLDILERENLIRESVIRDGRANVFHWRAVQQMSIGRDRTAVRRTLLSGLRTRPAWLPLWKRMAELHLGSELTRRIRAVKLRARLGRT